MHVQVRGTTGAGYTKALVVACCSVLAAILPSCSTDLPARRAAPEMEEAARGPRFSIVLRDPR